MQQRIGPDQIKRMLDSAQERLAEVADSVQRLVRRLRRVDEKREALELERQRFEEGPSRDPPREVRRFQDKVDEVQSELDDVEAAVEELQANSAELADDLSDIQSTITRLEERIRGQTNAEPAEDVLQKLAELSQRVGRLGADRAVKIERELGAARQRIASERDRVEALKAPLGVNGEPREARQFVVRGTVRDKDGRPLEGAAVKAFDKDLRSEQLLGEVPTDQNGRYEIRYTRQHFRRAEKQSADLIVKALDDNGQRVAESGIVFNASEDQTVDLLVGGGTYPGPSEFDRTLESIEPVILDENGQRVSPADLADDELEFLANETGTAAQLLQALRAAFRMSASNQVSPPTFYGLISQGLPAALPELLQESLQSMRRALEAALEENLIPLRFRDALEHELDLLRQLRVDQAVETRPAGAASSSLGDILQTAPTLSRDRQRTIADLLTNTSLSREKLGETLIQEHGFSESEAAEATDTLERAEITLGHAPLMARVRDTPLQDLSGDPITWRQAIDEFDDQAVPPIIQGDDEEVRKDRYAHVVARAVERKFPTRVFGERLGSDQEFDLPQREQVAAFVSREQDFDLSGLPIRRYLAENDPDLDGIGDVDSFIQAVEGCQRVHRLGAGFDGCKALYSEGLTSGWAISQQSPTQFRTRLQGKIDPREADAIYDNALHKVASTQALLIDFNEMRNGPLPRVLQIDVDFEDDNVTPELRNLFGPLDFCACKHCRSVLSPAAYLVDVLRFLDNREPTADRTPLEVLAQRRPDIGKIALTCENTNTLVPYIDLVNEILEQEVLRRQELPTSEARQTTRTSEELRAFPEHLDPMAYQVLREITGGSPPVYPWVLPFDLWAEETRAYLAHLDVDRGTLLEEFRLVNEPGSGYPDNIDVAAEQLGLTRTWWEILAGETGLPVAQFWNGRTATNLETVSVFLKTARTDYSQLLELLETEFVQPDADRRVEMLGESTCDTEEMRLRNLDDDALDRIHRFLRLQRHLDWSMRELDEAIQLLGDGDLDAAFLLRLAALQRASEELDQSREELIRLWRADIPRTRREESLAGTLNLGIRELRTMSALLGVQPLANGGVGALRAVARLAALLREADFTVAELDYLVNADPQLGLEVEPAEAAIAEVLEDLRQGLRKIQEETRIPDEPSADLVKQWLTALNWPEGLSAETASQLATVELTEEDQESLRSSLTAIARETELQALPAELVFPSDMAGRMRYDGQARLREDGVTGVLRFAGPMSEEDRNRLLTLADGLADDGAARAYRDAINRLFGSPDVSEPRVIKLLEAPEIERLLRDTDTSERLRRVLAPLGRRLREVRSEALVTQRLAGSLGLEVNTAQRLLDTYAQSDGTAAGKVFLPDDEAESLARTNPDVEINRDDDRFTDAFKAYETLYRAALVVDRFELSVSDLAWLYDSAGPIDLNALPHLTQAGHAAAVQEWIQLAELLGVARRHLKAKGSLQRILRKAQQEPADRAGVLDAIDAETEWSRRDIEILEGSLRLEAADYSNGQALVRLGQAFRRMARIDLPEGQVEGVREFGDEDFQKPVQKLIWFLQPIPADAPAAQSFTRAIRKTLEENHAPEKWPEIGQQLRDPLREKQVKALREYLLAQGPPSDNPDATNPDATWSTWDATRDLHDYFLVDVEMTSCMMTSRIKLAHSSVQLFVQRALMNLEPGVKAVTDPSEAERWSDLDEDWLQWDWMKNYRVWEANRKVFLWPENWIEPELRDSKSPFFEDLENELLQEDITYDTAESAFLNYLEKLNTVARLEVCGMVNEPGDKAGEGILHVFGRTRATPRTYFYRRREKNGYGSHWTPWEEVDVDIEGDYLIPVIWHRRLYLFWPTFREKSERVSLKVEDGKGMPEDEKYAEMRVASSVRRRGKWSEKQVGNGVIVAPPEKFARFHVGWRVDDEGALHLDFKTIVSLVGKAYDVRKVLGREPEDYASSQVAIVDRYASIDGDRPHPDSEVVSRKVAGNDSRVLRVFDPERTNTWSAVGGRREGDLVNTLDLPRKFLWAGEFVLSSPHAGMQTNHLLGEAELLEDPVDTWGARGARREGNRLGVQKRFGFTLTPSALSGDIDVFYFPEDAGDESAWFSSSRRRYPELVLPFFIEDGTKTFFAELALSQEAKEVIESLEELEGLGAVIKALVGGAAVVAGMGVRFHIFYHPYASLLLRELSRLGLSGILNRRIQTSPTEAEGTEPPLDFNDYGPNPDFVREPYPVEGMDFDAEGAYAPYNWELFFHAPFLIADQLSGNQRFEEAQKWFHYVFDPTDTSDHDIPQRYWITKEFHDRSREDTVRQRIEDLLRRLAEGTEDPKLANQIEQWREDPFNPHLIARLRTVAYQKAVVMKYLDNLIGWGDQLFRQDTIESINEATQVYMLAADILGPPPQKVERVTDVPARTFEDLKPNLDGFGNALVAAEAYVPGTAGVVPVALPSGGGLSGDGPLEGPLAESGSLFNSDGGFLPERATSLFPKADMPLPSFEQQLYFCIPPNETLLRYWDTVADRLFKIRHCMNIEGMVRRLALFEPPIDPGLLVGATARGMDVRTALRDVGATLPHYRFRIMIQRGIEICDHVRSFGGALQGAIEKRDSEELSQLRASREVRIQKEMEEVRRQQLEVAEEELEALRKSRAAAQERRDHYASLEFINPGELAQLALMHESVGLQGIAALQSLAASVAQLIPEIKGGSPFTLGTTFGGRNVASALEAHAGFARARSSMLSTIASTTGTLAGYQRRQENWDLQKRQAERDIERVDNQIEAARLRVAIARRELKVHETRIGNAEDVRDLMEEKFSNRELYRWMVGQISSVYFQAYELALEVARAAERTYQYEMAVDDTFITSGYWDNLHQGLLAGDKLRDDLKRMEAAYFRKNRREYELTKHISLRLLDPIALTRLKETGACIIQLPEAIFDMDFPGHYMRRIKSVSLTIPAVTGPYTGVNCTLTLLGSETRQESKMDVDVVAHRDGAVESIATSSGQSDSGLFQLNFQDERYLPFEGAGAVSTWRLQIGKVFPQFDHETISDVVIHLNYTARNGGEGFRSQVAKDLVAKDLEERAKLEQMALGKDGERTGLFQLFSARHDFPSEWHRFFHPGEASDELVLTLGLSPERFPFFSRHRTIEIKDVHLLLSLRPDVEYADDSLSFTLRGPSGAEHPPDSDDGGSFSSSGSLVEGMPYAQPVEGAEEGAGTWTIVVSRDDIPDTLSGEGADPLDDEAVRDILVICNYQLV